MKKYIFTTPRRAVRALDELEEQLVHQRGQRRRKFLLGHPRVTLALGLAVAALIRTFTRGRPIAKG